MVEEYLIEKGYRIVEKNYQKRSGEIDLIANDPDKELVFIEVKTRRSKRFGKPEEAVDKNKLAKIEKTAEQWIEENNISNQSCRIDIIALELGPEKKITHLKNVSL